jgi:peptidoglycan/LPS O-acetylase OafA/YrhL
MIPAGESPNLDFLRSVAVTDVVLFHLLLFFHKKTDLGILWSIGHWGVLLFFVHTSLVLMSSLERQESRIQAAGIFWPFYLRRFFRIFPLSVVVVTLIGLFGLPVGHLKLGTFYAVHLNGWGFVSNLLLIQNLTKSESITAPLWSLPVEVGMYLVLPLIYLLARASRTFLPLLGLWAISVLTAYASIRILHYDQYTFMVCGPCFMAGIVSYKLAKSATVRLPFIGWPLTLAVLTFLYLRLPKPSRSWIWCLLLGLTLPYFSELTNLWLRSACHYVARYSYGIYLTHFACIWFAFAELASLPLALRWLVFVATAGAAPVLLYHTVEAPMISLGHRIVNSLAGPPGQGRKKSVSRSRSCPALSH